MGKLGITAVVDLSTHGGNFAKVPEADYLRIQIDDDAADSGLLLSAIPDTLEFMGSRLRSGQRLLVHCDKGQSRSAAVIVAWLMAMRDCDYDAALRSLWSTVQS